MKTCSKCSESKDDSYFHKHATKGLQSICKPCKSIQQKEYRDQNREAFNAKKNEHHKARRNEIRDHILNHLSKNPCIVCGEADPIVLEFDHRQDKLFGISSAIRHLYSIEKLKAEIEKCDIRCANCHKRKTAKDFNWYKSKGE